MSQEQLQQLLLAARQAVKAGQAGRALALLEAALRLDPSNALAWFSLGQAHAALGAAAAAADAFRRCAQLTAGAKPGTQLHALHTTATDNALLESEAVMPPGWIAALHDAPRLAALQAGIAAAVQQAALASGGGTQQPLRVLVCGGLGLEAVLAAQAGASAVTLFCEGNPLAAHLAAELAADSGCADRLSTATAAAQLGAEAQPGSYSLVILADALGSSIDWGLLQRQLAAAAPLLPQPSGGQGGTCYGTPVLLPHAVRIRGQLVECAEAVALNEVNVAQLAANTGGLDLAAANRLLPRASRSVRLPAYRHTALSSPATLLTVPLASLLPCGHDARTGHSLAAGTSLEVTAAGAADALCWCAEQQLTAAGAGEQQDPLVLSAAPSSCPAADADLHPHIWQHVQFLNHRPLAAGQPVEVQCSLAGGSSKGGSCSSGNGTAEEAASDVQALSLSDGQPAGSKSTACLRFDVLLQDGSSAGDSGSQSLLLEMSAEQAAIAAAVPRYHTAMLNDSARTAAYRDGIAAAMREAAAKAAAAAAAAGRPAEAPLVLEIGSGSGLLLLLARQTGARRIIGCERLPELQRMAAQLLEANGAADSVTVLPKHSRALTVAGPSGGGSGAESSQADLPRQAEVLLHEIFGTDPFSEGVVPSLVHARQHLLAPGAVLAPCKLHVVAAVVASPTLGRLLRPPVAVCGGAVHTAALAQLAPRKVDCQTGEAGGLLLLTEPARVLSVDFAAEGLPLADSATALLECLPQPVSMAAWAVAQQQEQGGAATGEAAADGAASSEIVAGGQAPLGLPGGCSLFAVSWFEYEFPGGVCGSSAPHMQRSEHWQQVVQLLEGPVAEAALDGLLGGSSSGSEDGAEVAALLLTAGYRMDRLWFELEGVAAAAADADGEGEDDCEGASSAASEAED